MKHDAIALVLDLAIASLLTVVIFLLFARPDVRRPSRGNGKPETPSQNQGATGKTMAITMLKGSPTLVVPTLFLKDYEIRSAVTMIGQNAGFSRRAGDPDVRRASTPVLPR